jgi:hypothetical protein
MMVFQHDGAPDEIEIGAARLGARFGTRHQCADDLVEPDNFVPQNRFIRTGAKYLAIRHFLSPANS